MNEVKLAYKVLDTGEIEERKSKAGNTYYQRRFQVYDTIFKASGNVDLRRETKEELEQFKQGGDYFAVLAGRAGNYGTLGYEVVDLIHTNQPQPKANP